MEGCSKMSAGAASGLPEGPLVEILSRVPAKSVCRFKCVSKGWCDLIADPAIRKKLRQAMQGLFVQTTEVERNEVTRVSTSFIDLAVRAVPLDIDPSFSFLSEMTGIRTLFFLDSCNGLILLGHNRESTHASASDYFVCNPTTKEWLGIPACGSRAMLSHTYLAFDPALSSFFHLVQFQIPDVGMKVVSLHVYSSETGTWSQNQLEGQIDGLNEQGPTQVVVLDEWVMQDQMDYQNEQVQWQLVGQVDEQGLFQQLQGQIDEQNEQGQLEGQIHEQNEQGQLEGQIVRQNEQAQLKGWHNQFELQVHDYHCAFVNGLLHMIVWGPEGKHILVVDLQGKAKRIITVPDLSQRAHYLGQSQGHLHCVTIKSSHEIHDTISIWVLQDYDAEKWALKMTVNSLDVFGETEARPKYFVVDIHQDCNVLFFFHQLTNELIAYNMDRNEVSVLSTFQHSRERDDFARYIPYFLESPALTNKH